MHSSTFKWAWDGPNIILPNILMLEVTGQVAQPGNAVESDEKKPDKQLEKLLESK